MSGIAHGYQQQEKTAVWDVSGAVWRREPYNLTLESKTYSTPNYDTMRYSMSTKQERMMQMTFIKLPKAITAEELLSTPLPPVKWIVPGLLPAGLALFAGPSKAGKSWLTLWLCL